MRSRTQQRRRGTVYLLVLLTTAIVAVTGVTALTVARLQRRTAADAASFAAARFAAQSAIDYGVFQIASNSNWRTGFANSSLLGSRGLGDSTLTLAAEDPKDADFADWPYDPVVLTGLGASGPARYALQATLEARRTPLPILATCIHAAGGITVAAGRTLSATGGPVSTNGTLTCSGATIAGDVNCLVVVNLLGTISGTTTILSTAKAMPPASVVSMYAGAATALSPGTGTISNSAIGPGYTPWGPTNEDGLYVITAGGGLTLSNSRIEGTLVVLCPGKTLTIDGSVLLHNYRSDFPALIVDGNLELKFTGGTATLSEAALGTNLNLAGVPYQGTSDNDIADTYASEIGGLVHATGTITVTGAARVNGVVISSSAALLNAVDVKSDATFIHDDSIYTNPPLGYEATLEWRPVAGSWSQIEAP